jgi:Caspase domain
MRLAGIFFQLVTSPCSQVVQNAQLRRFIVQQCSERRFGLACVRLNHVQLLYNAALIFDATFKVLILPLDVGNRFLLGAPLKGRVMLRRLPPLYLSAISAAAMMCLTISGHAASCGAIRVGITSFCQPQSWLSRLLGVVWPDSNPYQIAVVAGIARYPNLPNGEQLPPVDYDIDTLTTLLRNRFGFDEVVVLQDGSFSRDNLRYVFSQYIPTQLIGHAKSQVLFAYSGHGADYANTGYIFFSDTRTIDPHSYSDLEKAIDLDELKILMKPSVYQATHFLALLNSCKGGYFLQSGTFSFGASALDARGAHGITAGGRQNSVHALKSVGSGNGSVFFEMLFSALNGSGTNINGVFISDPAADDGILSTIKLADFLNRTIEKIEDYKFGPQMGRLYGSSQDDGEGYFFFITNENKADQAIHSRYPKSWDKVFGKPSQESQPVPPGLYARLSIPRGIVLNADMFDTLKDEGRQYPIDDDVPLSFPEHVRGACLDRPLNKGQRLTWSDLRVNC